MAIDDLIRELAAEGRVDSEGHFTLDRAKAREKTRKFQLAEPLHYLLELVQAAVARGATRLDFRIDTDDMWLEYDGTPWTLADVDGLYDALLSPRASLEDRRCLAIGLNSAMALDPAHLRLESGDVRLEMRPDHPDDFGPLDPPRAGTRVHVRDRFSASQVWVFFRRLFGQLAEVELLQARCGDAPIPIVVNGTALAATAEPELAYATTFSHPNGEGVVGFDPRGDEGELLLITHGVWITRVPLQTQGLRARVHALGLTKDASRFAFVEDDAYRALRAALSEAENAATAKVVEAARADGLDPDDWRTQMAFARLDADRGPLAQMPARLGAALAEQLQQLPWIEADGALSLAQLATRHRRWARLAYTPHADLGGLTLPGDEPVLVLPDKAQRDALRDRFGLKALVDRSEALRAVEARRRRRAAWLARPTTPTLAPGRMVHQRPIAAGPLRGEIGLRHLAGKSSLLSVVIDGHAYAQQRVDLGLPGLEIVIEGGLEPDAELEWLAVTPPARRAVEAVAAAIEGFFAELAAQGAPAHTPLLRGWFELRWAGDWLAALRALFAWPESEPIPPAIVRTPPPATGPLGEVPLFATTQGADHRVGLRQLAERAEAGPIPWVVQGRRPLPGLSPWLLRLDDADRLLIEAVLGGETLTDGGATYQHAERQAAFWAQPATGPTLAEGAVAEIAFEHDGVCGRIGFNAEQQSTLRVGGPSSRVRVFNAGRLVHAITVTLPIGPLSAAVESDHLAVSDDHTRVHLESGAVHRVALALTRALPQLLETVVRTDRVRAVHLGRAWIDAVYPFAALRAVADDLRHTHGAAAADRRYPPLLDRVWSLGGLAETRLATLVARGKPISARALSGNDDRRRIALLRLLIDAAFHADDARPPLARLVEATPGLGYAPVLRAPDGRWLSVAEVLGAVAEGHAVVPCPRGTPPTAGRLDVWLDDGELDFVQRMVGAAQVVPLEAWTRRRALEVALAARPQRPMVLPAGRTCAALVRPEGAVGLAHPNPSGASVIEVFVRGRHITDLTLALPTRVHAVLALDEAELRLVDGALQLDPASERRAHAWVDAHLDAALTQLSVALPSDANQRLTACHHALDAIAQRPDSALASTLSGVSLLPRLGQRPASLLGLRRHLDAQRVASVVRPGVPAEPFEDDEADWVLVLPATLEILLIRLVSTLPTYAERRAELASEQAFQAQAQVAARLDPDLPTLARQPISWRGLSGEVGLRADVAHLPYNLNGHPLPLQVLHQGRPLCEVQLWSPLRGLVAVVESADLRPNDAFDGLASTWPLIRVQQAIHAAARKMPYRSRKAERATLGPLALDLVRVTYPSPVFQRAHAALRAQRRKTTADEVYAALLQTARRTDLRRAEAILADHLAAGRPLTRVSLGDLPIDDDGVQRSELAARVSGTPFSGSSQTPPADRIVSSLPGVAKVPVTSSRAGEPLTLSQLLHRAKADGVVLHGPGDDAPPHLLTLASDADPALACLLGEALQTVAAWRLGEARRAAIDALPPLPELPTHLVPVQIELPDGAGCVGLSIDPKITGIDVGVRGRRVAHLPLEATLPLVAVLTPAAVDLRWTGTQLDGLGDAETLSDSVRDAGPDVVRAMAQLDRTLSSTARDALYPAALRALAEWAPGSGAAKDRVPEGLHALVTVKGLRSLENRRLSLDALRGQGDRPFWVCPPDAPVVEGIPGVMVRADAQLAGALRALFPRVLDGSDRLAQRQAALATRAAQPLPEPPADAWAVRTLKNSGLKGAVWLPRRGPHTVALGADGGEVHRLAAHTVADVPFCAALRGDALGVDPFRPEARLTKRGTELLLRALGRLYDDAIDTFLEGAVAPADAPALEARLQTVAVGLVRGEARVPARLLRTLRTARIFDVPEDGRRSLNELERHRPPVWDHLGLWPSAPAEPRGEAPTPEPPAPEPEPEPSPAVIPLSPEEALLAQLCQLLRLMREDDGALFHDLALGRLTVRALDGRSPVHILGDGPIVFDRSHPFVARRLAAPTPIDLAWLATLAFGALAEGQPDEAAREATFLHRLMARIGADPAI